MSWLFRSKSKVNEENGNNIETDNQEPIETLNKLLSIMDCKATVEQSLDEVNNIILNINTDESGRIIGDKGETLYSLQYLLNKIIFTKNAESPKIIIDIDQYRSKRKEKLINMALSIAEEVKKTKKPSSLPPLNSFDRKTVHESLRDDKEVDTLSKGEGYYKKVFISVKN